MWLNIALAHRIPKKTSNDWHTGYIECENEHNSAPLRIPNLKPVLSTGSQNENLFYKAKMIFL
jgi:hypothetical protein